MSDFFKSNLRIYLIVLAFLVAGSAVLITVEMLSRSVRCEKLQEAVIAVIERQFQTEFEAVQTIDIPLPFAVSAYAVSAVEKNAGSASAQKSREVTGIIAQIVGICGPVPAVFAYTRETGCVFAGIAGIKEPIDAAAFGITRQLSDYWIYAITRVLGTATADSSAAEKKELS
ncbi:MAG: hypothetical protein NC041_04270 [Bacteroides sp.]|nr:hypothetical protein [Prevotella sp.]MCM1407921.1 hypothetical protein [Treponema brennaborense]MCM1469663.1 hypothetical protein [Bacteroides sp.]